jgi:nifR3 family TIM-barrel protein
MQAFWHALPKPFFVLAPLAGVTDPAFRRLIARYGKPHAMWTEFTSADGLCAPGRDRLLRGLAYTESERPIVAQLFGAKPETMERAAALAAELGFDGIDINMGCPDRNVEKRGAGAALCKQPALAQAMIRAAKRGAGSVPVSAKIRIGYDRNELATWLPALLEAEPVAITIHARTRQEMSLVPAHWDAIAQAVDLRNRLGAPAYIVGNGDVVDLADARRRARDTGADGVMLGRAIFGHPWLFDERRALGVQPAEKLRVLLEHTRLFEELLGDIKSLDTMKKHYKSYLKGFDGAKALFLQLMEARDVNEVETRVRACPILQKSPWAAREPLPGRTARPAAPQPAGS